MNEQILTNRPLFPAQLDMSHPLTKGLVGCWVMNEEGGKRLWDSSPYGRHGLVTGAKGRWQGKLFNGTGDFIEIQSTTTYNFTSGDFSLFMWLNPIVGVLTRLIITGAVTTGGWGFTLAANGIISVTTHQAAANQETYTGVAAALVSNRNVFIGFTRRAAKVIIYQDGLVPPQTSGAHTDPVSSAVTPKIGANATGGANYFQGILSVIWIYNRCLIPGEIKDLYAHPYNMFLK